jgi:hypothetical protein
MVPASSEIVPRLVYLDSAMIFHDSGKGVLDLMQCLILITVHLCVAIVTEVGCVIVAKPGRCLVLTEITHFYLNKDR